jgi:hypothetical protein
MKAIKLIYLYHYPDSFIVIQVHMVLIVIKFPTMRFSAIVFFHNLNGLCW